ncbi:glutamate racemase [Candidatus Riesia pediculischaeffi]|uniref:Glutamate racemase n=1 Tax=Candidatus Riesia pediculischaeffi PTSU TaxID=1401651 RepID=A0A0C1VK21_9ENTR|nr:glutamate racemase [Candidatus Riesia pediculischaeffi]KIE64210.1 Glutamate racemase [Candidatus Riesia pediculischaeffi PTSU]
MQYINRPINVLIFDSGLGGLSIYKYLFYNLPSLNYVYVFDSKFFPYGDKEDLFIINRVIKIINKIQKNRSFEIIVLACNTVSVTSIGILKKVFPNQMILGSFPEVDIAVHSTKNNIVCLLATRKTVEHMSNVIERYSKKYEIYSIYSSEIVELAEKKIRGVTVSKNRIQSILIGLSDHKNPDTIILGCTHFSFISSEIKEAFPSCIHLIDSKRSIYNGLLNFVYKQQKNKIFYGKSKNLVLCTGFDYKIKKLYDLFITIGFSDIQRIIV